MKPLVLLLLIVCSVLSAPLPDTNVESRESDLLDATEILVISTTEAPFDPAGSLFGFFLSDNGVSATALSTAFNLAGNFVQVGTSFTTLFITIVKSAIKIPVSVFTPFILKGLLVRS